MEGSFPASSFHPPAVARANARYGPWALLDRMAYFAACDNATTAEAVTSTGHAIKVTFCLADPPGISHFCVHGPDFQPDDFFLEPCVLSSVKDLVLLRFAFTVGPRSTRRDWRYAEYFVYKAGRGRPPSLTPIPLTPPDTVYSFRICVLPFDDGESFLLADLSITGARPDYELHVFSSKTGKWTTTALQLRTPPGVYKEDLPGPQLAKVIALGGGAVGWVDLWRGIVTCNLFDKNPVLTFIPIPILELNPKREGEPRPVRDVVCCNGFIRFIELDIRVKQVDFHTKKTRKVTKDLDTVDIIYDSELLFHNDDARANPVESILVDDGWKIRTCYRHPDWDYWRKGHAVDIDDISSDNPDHFMLLPHLWDANAGRSTLRNLISAYPTMGVDGDDVVYLMSKVEHHDKNAWMIGVDLRKKTVEVVVPVSSERVCLFKPDNLTCEFTEYLNATPSTCAKKVTKGAPNGAQSYHLLSSDNITENTLPPQQNVGNSGYYYNGCFYGYADGAHPSNSYGNYQHPTTWPANNLPQPPDPNLTSSGSGCAYPVSAQPTYQGLYTDAGGQVWVLLPLGSAAPPLYPLMPLAHPHFAPLPPPFPSAMAANAVPNTGQIHRPGC